MTKESLKTPCKLIKLFRGLASDGVYTHGLSKEDEVGIRHSRMGIPGIVEEVETNRKSCEIPGNARRDGIERALPLQNHSLESVVQRQDLHSHTELASRLKLHSGHAETGVSIDIDDGLVWSSDLRTDSRWQTEAHGLQSRNTLALASYFHSGEGDARRDHHWSPNS